MVRFSEDQKKDFLKAVFSLSIETFFSLLGKKSHTFFCHESGGDGGGRNDVVSQTCFLVNFFTLAYR